MCVRTLHRSEICKKYNRFDSAVVFTIISSTDFNTDLTYISAFELRNIVLSDKQYKIILSLIIRLYFRKTKRIVSYQFYIKSNKYI